MRRVSALRTRLRWSNRPIAPSLAQDAGKVACTDDPRNSDQPVSRCLPGEEGIEIVERAKAHGVARGARGAADMGQHEDVFMARKGRGAPRLDLEAIETGGGEVAALDTCEKRVLVDQRAARGVDDDRALGQPRDAVC